MAQVPVTPELCIELSKNVGFQARLEMQIYIHAKWVRDNWSNPANLAQQKALAYAHAIKTGFNIERSTAVKLALAGLNGTVDDQVFDQAVLESRTVILFEDLAGVLPGDDLLPVE